MKEFVAKKIMAHELTIINNWRIYFKVTFLSEICNTEGTHIRECFIRYPEEEVDNGTESKWQWPEQAKPGPKCFGTVEHTLPWDTTPADGYVGEVATFFHFYSQPPALKYLDERSSDDKWYKVISQHIKILDMELLQQHTHSQATIHIITDGGIYDHRGM
jgi:hypothetical protein